MLNALRMLHTHGRERTGTSDVLWVRITKPWSGVGLEAVQRSSELVRRFFTLTRAGSPPQWPGVIHGGSGRTLSPVFPVARLRKIGGAHGNLLIGRAVAARCKK